MVVLVVVEPGAAVVVVVVLVVVVEVGSVPCIRYTAPNDPVCN